MNLAKQSIKLILVLGIAASMLVNAACQANIASFTRKEDVIYGRKFGTALTMDVFTPNRSNGYGIVWIVSGGWYSDHQGIDPGYITPFLEHGYTVFAVVHGSQPKYSILDIVEDLFRAVRFIRYHHQQYGVDPNHLGTFGISSGGHLALFLGMLSAKGDSQSPDPIDRGLSKVHAVVAFAPPSDFLNYGKPGESALGCGLLKDYAPAFAFQEYDQKTNSFVLMTNAKRKIEMGGYISPINLVNSESAPSLIFHGAKDKLVPIQQSQNMISRLKSAGIPAELATKQNLEHSWDTYTADMKKCLIWFDRYLRNITVGP